MAKILVPAHAERIECDNIACAACVYVTCSSDGGYCRCFGRAKLTAIGPRDLRYRRLPECRAAEKAAAKKGGK